MRGGVRPGAGRPKGTTKAEVRKARNTRAFDYEWDAVKIILKAIKKDKTIIDKLLAVIKED